MRRAATVLAFLAAVVVLAACDGRRPTPAADTPGHARLPERTPAQAGYELLDALLLGMERLELPPGFHLAPDFARLTGSAGGVIAHPPEGSFLATGALAGVAAPVQGFDPADRVGFIVYATAAEAAAGFGAERPAWAPVTERSTPVGFDAPAQCLAVPAPPPAPGGASYCSVLVGNAKVYGTAMNRDDPARGRDEAARALARAGVAHLAAVRAALADAANRSPETPAVSIGFLYPYWWIGPGLFRRFQERLAELGYVRGHNLAIEYRFYENQFERIPALAAELVGEQVDVIVAGSDREALAAKAATSTIPIVFVALEDPVGAGLVASLARPGGNVTGVSTALGPAYAGKLLELLTEAVPSIRRVAVFVESTTGPTWTELERVAEARAVALVPLELRSRADLDAALEVVTVADAQAILWASQPDSDAITAIAAFAQRRRIPGVYFGLWPFGLLTYYVSLGESFARAAVYVDRILKGAAPGDLPVDLVSTYVLIVNLRVAEELGLTVAPSVLARATTVIR
jgi:putative ABC transport system substrate-binding protein